MARSRWTPASRPGGWHEPGIQKKIYDMEESLVFRLLKEKKHVMYESMLCDATFIDLNIIAFKYIKLRDNYIYKICHRIVKETTPDDVFIMLTINVFNILP